MPFSVCPKCGATARSAQPSPGTRRSVYSYHVGTQHFDLGDRERSLLADAKLRQERPS